MVWRRSRPASSRSDGSQGEVVGWPPNGRDLGAVLAVTADRFPDCPPYEAIPPRYLTVGGSCPIADADDLSVVACPAHHDFVSELVLVEDDAGRWSIGHRWPLG